MLEEPAHEASITSARLGGKTAEAPSFGNDQRGGVMPSAEFENLVQMFKAQRTDAEPTVPELRTAFDLLGQMMPVAEGVHVEETTLGGLPTDRLTVDGADTDRVLLYLHGGGYCIGTHESHRPVASALAKATGIPVLLPEYRLAPEAPFPAAVEDARAAYDELLETFAPDRIVVAGESAGGGLTAALLVSLRDDGRPLPAAAALLSPWCDLNGLGDVSDEAMDLDFLRPEALTLFVDSYAPGDSRSHVLASPGTADLTGLPPLLVQAGECEILLDMGRRLASQAKDCGVDVTLEVEPGMFHAWHLFTVLPESADSVARVASFFRDRLT
jgi:acetyl esterase/lipase